MKCFPLLNRSPPKLACGVVMPNFNSIGSGVSEPQIAENRYLPLTCDITLTTVTHNVLHCKNSLSAVFPKTAKIEGNFGSLPSAKLYFIAYAVIYQIGRSFLVEELVNADILLFPLIFRTENTFNINLAKCNLLAMKNLNSR